MEDQYRLINNTTFRECFCPLCDEHYTNRPRQTGGGVSKNLSNTPTMDTHNAHVRKYEVIMKDLEFDNVEEFFAYIRLPCTDILSTECTSRKNYKLFHTMKIRFVKYDPEGVESECIAGFTSFSRSVLHSSMIPRTLQIIFDQFDSPAEAYTREKSG